MGLKPVAVCTLLGLLFAATSLAKRPPKLDNMYIPDGMKENVKQGMRVQNAKNLVESYKNVGFFPLTDNTFAPYLSQHSRFFALLYAPFSQECVEFLEGYKQASASLVEEGYASNFSAVDCMSNHLLCQYHGTTSFPPPVVLFFDRNRKRKNKDDKAYRKIPIPVNAKPRQFMRGLFLNLIGEVDDPYEEWERWDDNGALLHINVHKFANWEETHGDSVVVLFGASTSDADRSSLARLSERLQDSGVQTAAINCAHHDEVCVQTFKPLSFPAVYYKRGETFWKGYRGAIEADAIFDWTGVEESVGAQEL